MTRSTFYVLREDCRNDIITVSTVVTRSSVLILITALISKAPYTYTV